AWHLLDGDEGIICLLRDNHTIAGEEEIVRDHDLMKRTHTYNILAAHSRRTDEFSAALHWYEGPRGGERRVRVGHIMDFLLRPGEWIEWRWDHAGKQYTSGTPLEGKEWKKDGEGDLTAWGANAYDKLRNGRMRYEPPLRRPAARRGVVSCEGVVFAPAGPQPALHPETRGAAGRVTWQIGAPYVIVGGRVTLAYVRGAEDELRLEYSRDGEEWEEVWRAASAGAGEESVILDPRLSPRGKPQYRYQVRLVMRAAGDPRRVGIHRILFDTDLQMAALSLPELEVGENRVEYRDETRGPRRVRVLHQWIERTSMRPPGAPPAPLFPPQGGVVDGTRFTFSWKSPAGAVDDYHLQLADEPSMRWPLSPNFNRLISKTPERGR
ncbi:MAG: hypothetical protein QHJ73_20005, partial [Armatimonadota bacterium]|nr:hypothetical protein [Armatimonadota bacterium]